MTTIPAPAAPTPADRTDTADAAAPDTAPVVDQALAQRAHGSGEYLAGLIATAMLDTHARPNQLPADLFPHIPPEHVQAVWDRALAVGYRAGRYASAPRLNRDTLHRLQLALADAGYAAMAGLAEHTLRTVDPEPGQHPADEEPAVVRGEHW